MLINERIGPSQLELFVLRAFASVDRQSPAQGEIIGRTRVHAELIARLRARNRLLIETTGRE